MSNTKAEQIEHEQGFADWAIARIDEQIKNVNDRRLLATNQAERKAFDESADREIKELELCKDKIIKARIDLLSDDCFYIGTTAVDSTTPDFGYAGLAVINWQSDAASTFFYQASKQDPKNVHLRRTIDMQREDVVDLSDDILEPRPTNTAREAPVASESTGAQATVPDPVQEALPVNAVDPHVIDLRDGHELLPEPAIPEDALQINAAVGDTRRAPDLLLKELNSSRSLAMGEIVSTIQADQDKLIRADPSVPLIVQGGPGTGKTVVALHRASWVLFQLRESGNQEPNALIVGPNDQFIDYVRNVLPSLGETRVAHRSVHQLCLEHLHEADRKQVKPRRVANWDEAYAKGHDQLIEPLETAIWLHVRPLELKFPFDLFEFHITVEQVENFIEQFWNQRVPYIELRHRLEQEVMATIERQYDQRTQGRPGANRDVSRMRSTLHQHLEVLHWLDHVVPALRPHVVLRRFLSNADFLTKCTIDLPEELSAPLVEIARKRSSYEWCTEDLPLLSELAHLLGATADGFDHIVVDEAQDLSPMQWRAIRRHQRGRSGLVESRGKSSGSITITGDLAQATTVWSAAQWDDVADWAGLEGEILHEELRIGYRVPEESIAFAGRLIPVAAPRVDLPRSFRTGPKPIIDKVGRSKLIGRSIELAEDGLDDSQIAAIICPKLYLKKVQKQLKSAKLQDRIFAIDGGSSKGLEFDRVVILEPHRIIEDAPFRELGYRHLFVGMTRATKQLIICHGGPLPTELLTPLKSVRSERKALSTGRLTALTETHGERRARKIIDPNAYRAWTDEEEDELIRHYTASIAVDDIALMLRRSPSAVRSRLSKLGVTKTSLEHSGT